MQPTYQEQEKHLHEQYIAGLIEPFENKFCFCGNLKGERDYEFLSERTPIGSTFWPMASYTSYELLSMEHALLSEIHKGVIEDKDEWEDDDIFNCYLENGEDVNTHPNYEAALFNGMVASLEILKQIHISRGEIIDTPPVFPKRTLGIKSKIATTHD